MGRIIRFLVIVAGTFYLAIIYKSRSMIFLGYAEIFVMSLLLIYNLIGMHQIRISLEAPLGITEQGKKVPFNIKVQNYGKFPSGKIGVQITESCNFSKKKKKTIFYTSVNGRRYNEEFGISVIHTFWYPDHTGKVVMRVGKAGCFDLLGAIRLPLPKSAYNSSEAITVLPAIFQVPVDIGDAVRNYASEQEQYLQYNYDTEDTLSEQFQIRGYQPGDKLRSIHWKLSAKEGELMVKEYQPVKGCPVLFFLDISGDVSRKERREELRNREYFFTVAMSLSDSMIKQGCRHYVIWYDSTMKDVVRCCVEREEGIYELLASVNGIGAPPNGYNLQEEYCEKYHERSYATKIVLNRKLRLSCNDEQVIDYEKQNIEESLAAQTVYL